MPTVVLLGTLDTKGREYMFLCDRVREHGVEVLLVDAGILGEPQATPDIGRDEVAAAAGVDVASLVSANDRGAAIDAMARGAAEVVLRLHAEGRQARRHPRARRLGKLDDHRPGHARAARRGPEAARVDPRIG
jgi:hypothetical protein